MPIRNLDKNNFDNGEDWVGNNAAFTCPLCGKVFLVSGLLHQRSGRDCPSCTKSTGRVSKDGQTASIEWAN